MKSDRGSRKAIISGLGVSISALTHDDEEREKTINSSNQPILVETFTPLELLNEWKRYAESLTEEPHLKNTMLSCLPNLESRDTFEVVVNNPVQEQRLVDSSFAILSSIRERLKNTKVMMKVRISVDNEKKLGFTSLEKYNLMVDQNSVLKRLKDEFGLELM